MKNNVKKLWNVSLYNIKSINKLYYLIFIVMFFSLEYYVRVINSVYSNKETFDIFVNSFKAFDKMSIILIEIIICAYIIKINQDKKNLLIRTNDYSILLNANLLSVIILNIIIIGMVTITMFLVSLIAANFNIDIKYILKYASRFKIVLYFIIIYILTSSFYGMFIMIIYRITKSTKFTILISFLYSFYNLFLYPFLKVKWLQFLFIDYQLDLSTIINLYSSKINKYYFNRILYCFILFIVTLMLYSMLSKYKILKYTEKKSNL